VADVCRWFGHSPAVAARFYAQARTEMAEKASREPTILAAKEGSQVGSIAGYIGGEMGSKSGDITGPQNGGRNAKKGGKTQQKEPFSRGPEDSLKGSDKSREWAKRDSNPRHPLCKSGALTN
jgi:hypothetical protein